MLEASKNCIKCYMYYNNAMVTFFASDFMDLVNLIFNIDWRNENIKNQSFVKDEALINVLASTLERTINYEMSKEYNS